MTFRLGMLGTYRVERTEEYKIHPPEDGGIGC